MTLHRLHDSTYCRFEGWVSLIATHARLKRQVAGADEDHIQTQRRDDLVESNPALLLLQETPYLQVHCRDKTELRFLAMRGVA